MGQVYNHLSGEERNFIHRHLNEGRSCRWIAGHPGRSGPTLSREIKRDSGTAQGYDTSSAASSYRARRRQGLVKLREGTMLRQYVLKHIRLAWSPQQISSKLKAVSNPHRSVSAVGNRRGSVANQATAPEPRSSKAGRSGRDWCAPSCLASPQQPRWHS